MKTCDRVMVLSLPKAGTYLLAEVLRHLGYCPTHMHVGPEAYDRYDPACLQDGRDRPELFRVRSPWDATLKLIEPGQFAVGHLPFDGPRLEALEDFRVVFLKRDPRECLVSFMRWTLRTRRRERHVGARWLDGEPRLQVVEFLEDRGAAFRDLYRSLSPWNAVAGVEVLRFEDVLEGRIGGLLGHEEDAVARAISRAVGTETLTRSDRRSTLDEFWSERAEALYRSLFRDLHRELGYGGEARATPPTASDVETASGYAG